MTTKTSPKPGKAPPSRLKAGSATKATTKATKAANPPASKKTPHGASQAEAARKIEIFITSYLSNGKNATQAAKDAGFSPRTAHVSGCRLLKLPKVQAAIAEKHEEIKERMGLSLDRTLQEIARIAYGDPRKLYDERGNLKPIHELDDDTAAMVAGMEVDTVTVGEGVSTRTSKIKQHDKKGALDMAMRFHGAYDKDNSQKNMNVTIVMNDTDEAL